MIINEILVEEYLQLIVYKQPRKRKMFTKNIEKMNLINLEVQSKSQAVH